MGKVAKEELNRALSEHLNTIHETFQVLDQELDSSLDKVCWKEVIKMGEQVSKQATSRSRQPRSQSKGSDGTISSSPPSQNQQTRDNGQQILQSIACLSNRSNTHTRSPRQPPPGLGNIIESVPMGVQGADGQFDAISVMSQMFHSPALNGLLAGVLEQTGIGSPDALRNMFEQFTQNPAMRNTVNQIAQQFDRHDVGSMFSGFGRGQNDRIDLTSMVQQMMPIVSQALSGRSTTPPQPISVDGIDPQPQYNERSLNRDDKGNDQDSQVRILDIKI
ncbi:hypothetical protein U1Q18_007050 [Sarracenia purpurea var. burkii]